MRIRYSDDVDIITIHLREGKPIDSRDLAPGVILHFDKEGLPLEIEILDASKLAELGRISFEDSRLAGGGPPRPSGDRAGPPR